MKSLANQKRPVTFSSAIGEAARINGSILRNQVRTGKTAHAYLFDGLRGSGKTTTARTLAKAVNCLDPKDGEPCGCCEACRRIESGEAVDVKEIDAARNNGVDFAKSIEEDSNYRPVELKKKVYILDECHCLSNDAFSSLLKLVETPPEYCIFIFCTTDPQKVPVTIRSRCQEYRFKAVSQKELVAHLMGIAKEWGVNLEQGAAEVMARHSEGSVRDAVMALETCMGEEVDITEERATEILGAESWEQVFMVLSALVRNDRRFIVKNIERWFNEGRKISDVLSDCLLALTDKLRSLAGAEPEGTDSYLGQLRAWEVDEALALGLAEALKEAYEKVRYSPDKGILTVALLKAASGKAGDLSIRLARAEEEIRELKDMVVKLVSGGIPVAVQNNDVPVQKPVKAKEPELAPVQLPPAEAFETDFFDLGDFVPAAEPVPVATETVAPAPVMEQSEEAAEDDIPEQPVHSGYPLDDMTDEDDDEGFEWTEPREVQSQQTEEEAVDYAEAYDDGFAPMEDGELPEGFFSGDIPEEFVSEGYETESQYEDYEAAAPEEPETVPEDKAVVNTGANNSQTMVFDNIDDLFAQIENNATNRDRLEWKLAEDETFSGIAALCKREEQGDSVIFYAPNAEVQRAMRVLCQEADFNFVDVRLSA